MRVSLFMLVALLGYGCAAKKIAVSNADTLISRQVQKSLPLTDQQKGELNKDIVQFLNKEKNRVQELVPVIDEITLEPESDVSGQYEKLEAFYQRLAKDFSAMVAKYMAKLDSKQQSKMFDNLMRENKRILNKDKIDRLDGLENYLEHFFGKITNEQLKIISGYGDYLVDSAKSRVARRETLHKEFQRIYATEQTEDGRRDQILKAFLDYQNESAKSNKNLEILKKLTPTLTSEQRARFKTKTKEINELINYFVQTEY